MPQYILINEANEEIVEVFFAAYASSAEQKCRDIAAGSYLLCEVEKRIVSTFIPKVESNNYPERLFGGKFDPAPVPEEIPPAAPVALDLGDDLPL